MRQSSCTNNATWLLLASSMTRAWSGLPLLQRHREQQIAVVNPAVTVVIEAREVLDELDPALLEDAEIEPAVHALPLASRAHRMSAADERRELASWNRFWVVPCGTRKDVPSWMLGNVSCGPDASGLMTFLNVLKDAVVTLTSVGGPDSRPGPDARLIPVLARLSLRGGPDRAVERARSWYRPRARRRIGS